MNNKLKTWKLTNCEILIGASLDLKEKAKSDSKIEIKFEMLDPYKKLSYCWETVRRESMPRIAEMDVEMTT